MAGFAEMVTYSKQSDNTLIFVVEKFLPLTMTMFYSELFKPGVCQLQNGVCPVS